MSDQPPASGEIRLVVSSGKHRDKAVLLPPKVVVIGRSPQCHLRLGSGQVSETHCALAPHGRTLSVCDLSVGATYVNGERINRNTRVKHGDELRIGPVEFRVCVPRMLCWKEPLDRQRREIAWLWDEADASFWDQLDRTDRAAPPTGRPMAQAGSARFERNGDQTAIAAGRLWTLATGNGRNGTE